MKKIYDTFELMNEAVEILKRIGFEVANVSMKSEAIYLRWPGKDALVRIAVHSSKKTPLGLGYVASKIAFVGRHCDPPGKMSFTLEKLEKVLAPAIGRYFLNADKTPKILYCGPDFIRMRPGP